MEKKISIRTINYNNLKGLKRTIPSVLSQSYINYEYIVVDGGSNDGSKEYIASQQQNITQWISEKDNGVYNAMNKAVNMATGEYCLFMNSGDHFFSSLALEDAVTEMKNEDYFVGRTIVVESDFASLVIPPQTMSFRFIRDKVLQHQSTFIKTQLLKEHPYDENLKIAADWAHFLENWYFNKCSYRAGSTIISVYYADGISFQNSKLLKEERMLVLKNFFNSSLPHPKESKEIKRERINDDFIFKLKRAMKLKPIERDWKILRNGFKFLWKDLFI